MGTVTEKANRIWVVEMNMTEDYAHPKWEPTVGAKLTRKDGREELRNWKKNNPPRSFRLMPYRRDDGH